MTENEDMHLLQRQLELEKEVLRLDAPEDFASFLVYIDKKYTLEWFHREIARRCQMLLEGKIKNLMVFMPPQCGKSEIVSRCFPAWALGRNPDLKIVGCSYAADLANQFSLSVQRIIGRDEYAAVFPDTSLSCSGRQKGYTRNINFFETVGHAGFYRAVGVGGSLTGTPVDIAIIDDPVKDAMEAYSAVSRSRVWEWYNSVLTTRLHNDSRQIFIMTRWHEDDLAGRILQAEPDKWNMLSLPAICEHEGDGPLNSPRHIGDALWPQKHSLDKLLSQKERSPRAFSALYQQQPTIEGGNIILRSWFKTISTKDFEQARGRAIMTFFIDTAFTDKTSNDPTGIIAACKVGEEAYIVHASKVWMKFPDLVEYIPKYVLSHGYDNRSTIRIEPKANGLSVIDQLKRFTGLNVTKTATPEESKETRLNANSAFVESGRIILVRGSWNEEFIDEVCGFPTKPHDEYVDLLCYAAGYFFGNIGSPIDIDRLSKMIGR